MTFSTVSLAGVLSSAVTGAVQRPLSAMYSGAAAGGAFPVLRTISTRGIGYSQPQPSPTTPTPAAVGDRAQLWGGPKGSEMESTYAAYERSDPSGYMKYSGATAVGSRVYFTPYDEDQVGFVDTIDETFGTLALGRGVTGPGKFIGAAAVDGTIYFAPYSHPRVGVLCTSPASCASSGLRSRLQSQSRRNRTSHSSLPYAAHTPATAATAASTTAS